MTDKNRLRVRNWTKFQHFKDRRPPWIKLYRDVLEDRHWHALDPAAAKVLIGLWLLASEDPDQVGNLPDIDTISFRLRVSEAEVIQALKHLSGPFIEAHDISAISTRYQDDLPETERETERETETEREAAQLRAPSPRSRKPKPTPVPTTFPITDSMRTWAAGAGLPNGQWLQNETAKFLDHHASKGSQFVDWTRAWQTWCRRGKDFSPSKPDTDAPRGWK